MHGAQALLNDSQKETLDADLARVQEIQKQLGEAARRIYAGVQVRPSGGAEHVLGIIFHQSTPEGSDVSSDYTPRPAAARSSCR